MARKLLLYMTENLRYAVSIIYLGIYSSCLLLLLLCYLLTEFWLSLWITVDADTVVSPSENGLCLSTFRWNKFRILVS